MKHCMRICACLNLQSALTQYTANVALGQAFDRPQRPFLGHLILQSMTHALPCMLPSSSISSQ